MRSRAEEGGWLFEQSAVRMQLYVVVRCVWKCWKCLVVVWWELVGEGPHNSSFPCTSMLGLRRHRGDCHTDTRVIRLLK